MHFSALQVLPSVSRDSQVLADFSPGFRARSVDLFGVWGNILMTDLTVENKYMLRLPVHFSLLFR